MGQRGVTDHDWARQQHTFLYLHRDRVQFRPPVLSFRLATHARRYVPGTISTRFLLNCAKCFFLIINAHQKQMLQHSKSGVTRRKPAILLIRFRKYSAQDIAWSTDFARPIVPRAFHINQNFMASTLWSVRKFLLQQVKVEATHGISFFSDERRDIWAMFRILQMSPESVSELPMKLFYPVYSALWFSYNFIYYYAMFNGDQDAIYQLVRDWVIIPSCRIARFYRPYRSFCHKTCPAGRDSPHRRSSLCTRLSCLSPGTPSTVTARLTSCVDSTPPSSSWTPIRS